MNPIYLDNNATTGSTCGGGGDASRSSPSISATRRRFMPSAARWGGPRMPGQVQALLGAEHDSEIIFTSCGTESDSAAILGAQASRAQHRDHHGGRASSHPDPLRLAREGRLSSIRLRVDKRGRIDMDEYRSLLHDRVAVVSVMGEQRDRTRSSGRRDGRAGLGTRDHVPHRRGAGGRQDPHRPQEHQDRHAFAVRSQAPCPQGHRRALPAPGLPLPPAAAWRSPGTRVAPAPKTRPRSSLSGKACELAMASTWT